MAITHEEPTNPTDPNRGMNVKVFLALVFAAAVLVAIILLVAVRAKGTKLVPPPAEKTHSTSQLAPPPGIRHSKPSPLHPVASLR